jgi:1,2-phenylacetyl-CoA epoxidase catalytic subunit
MLVSMTPQTQFVKELEDYVTGKLSSLDLLKEADIHSADRSDIVRRLKMALKNELEASELAAVWMPTTPEVDVKLALARQAGDEARHYKLIEKHLTNMGVDLAEFNPTADGYGPMFQLLAGFKTTVERIGAAQFTREALALKKNEQFIEFCEAAGDSATAAMYREQIQPDEEWHVHLGKQVLEKYANTPELQAQARKAVEAVLDLAVKIQNKQLKEMKVSHAPGC